MTRCARTPRPGHGPDRGAGTLAPGRGSARSRPPLRTRTPPTHAAARLLGLPAADVEQVRLAALVHELGITAIPNSILDRHDALTRAERGRVETHPLLTDQMLRRSQGLAILGPVASSHHERADGSGYHRRVRDVDLEPGARILAAAEVLVGLTTDRADRPGLPIDGTAEHLRALVAEGRLDARATQVVLSAAMPGAGGFAAARRSRNPAGLTDREVEVLKLAARGMTTRDIAERLFLSPKTADHHIQIVDAKTGVSTRAAAALWAVQNGMLPGSS